MDPTCQQGAVKAGGGSVMMWVCSVEVFKDVGLVTDTNPVSDYFHPFRCPQFPRGDNFFLLDIANPY